MLFMYKITVTQAYSIPLFNGKEYVILFPDQVKSQV